MSFDTLQFLLFFLIVYPLYWLLPHRARIPFLLLGSYYFYCHVRIIYLPIIIFSTLLDFWVGKKIEGSATKKQKKRYLHISLFANFSILCFFKYLDFFFGELAALSTTVGMNWEWTPLNIAFPIGVSFYTLQTISYTVDVYKGIMPAARNLWRFSLFVCFFPQLVAGPLEKARHLLPQFEKVQHFNFNMFYSGLWLVAWGAFKKTVVGDRLTVVIGDVFSNEMGQYFGPHFLLISYLSYAKFYCDFSGYTDMAMGLARMMGFRLSQNFRHPTWATNIAEFWRRWHITLFRWLRDYVYTDIVRSAKGLFSLESKKTLGVLAVFFFSGLWHGASWSFIAWGVINGCAVIMYTRTAKIRERAKMLPLFNRCPTWIGFIFGLIGTHFIISATMLFFMGPTLNDSLRSFSQILFNWHFFSWPTFFDSFGEYKYHLFIALITYVFVELVNLFDELYGLEGLKKRVPFALSFIALWAIVASVVLLHYGEHIAFAYFYF
jgi:alginate O-acetyltransferase complex protein AlgI